MLKRDNVRETKVLSHVLNSIVCDTDLRRFVKGPDKQVEKVINIHELEANICQFSLNTCPPC